MKNYLRENWFRLLMTLIIFVIHAFVYWIAPMFIHLEATVLPDWALTVFDNAPIIPFFIVFYFGCAIWWVLILETASKKRVYQIAFVALFGYIVIAICFLAFPLTMVRTEGQFAGNDIFSYFCRFMQNIDEAGKVFPSIHVFVSVLTYLAVAFDKEKKLWIRITSFIWLILVWIATLVLKQHYFVDGLAAVVLGVGLFFIIRQTGLGNWLYNLDQKMIDKYSKKPDNN